MCPFVWRGFKVWQQIELSGDMQSEQSWWTGVTKLEQQASEGERQEAQAMERVMPFVMVMLWAERFVDDDEAIDFAPQQVDEGERQSLQAPSVVATTPAGVLAIVVWAGIDGE